MTKIEVVLFEENYGTSSYIGDLKITPGGTVAKIYQSRDGDYYTIANNWYEFKPCCLSKDELNNYFKNSKHTMADEVSYVADFFKAHLEKQIENKEIVFIPFDCKIHTSSPFVNKTIHFGNSRRCKFKKVQSTETKISE